MFYGWRLMAALCLIYGLGIGGPQLGLGVALPTIAKVHGWSMGQASGSFSFLVLAMGCSGLLVGRLMDRFGARVVILAGGLLIAAGATLTMFTSSLLLFYLGSGVLTGMGIGMMAIVPGPTLIGRWFVRRRALMSSIYFLSSGVGGLVVAPVVASLLNTTQNWRAPWMVFAGCGLLGGIVGWIFARDRPEDLGQHPDGVTPLAATPADRSARSKPKASNVFTTRQDWKVNEALRSSAFWLVTFAWIGYGIGVQIILSQLVAHLTHVDVAVTIAASALGTVTTFASAGKLISGAFGDRVEPRYLLACGMLLQLIALIFLVNGHTTPLIYLFAAMFGAGFGMCFVTISLLLTNYFGTGPFPTLYGIAYMTTVMFSSLGPLVAGAFFSSNGSYQPVFRGLMGLLVLAGIAALLARPHRHERTAAAASTADLG